jgi:LPS-assembly protein
MLEGLAGIEYNACCWTARFVVQRLRTSTTRTNTTFYLQLELGGLLQIGSNPLRILQRSIPGYTNIDGQTDQYDDLELR